MRKLQHKGFTLLEVMVALSILSISVATLLIIRNNAVDDSLKAIQTRQLQNLLQQKITEAMIGIENKKSGDFGENGFEYFRWKIDERPKVLSAKDSGKSYQIAMREITVIVYHEEDPKKTYSLKTTVLLKKPDEEEDEKK